jgi:hypothetical protein
MTRGTNQRAGVFPSGCRAMNTVWVSPGDSVGNVSFTRSLSLPPSAILGWLYEKQANL